MATGDDGVFCRAMNGHHPWRKEGGIEKVQGGFKITLKCSQCPQEPGTYAYVVWDAHGKVVGNRKYDHDPTYKAILKTTDRVGARMAIVTNTPVKTAETPKQKPKRRLRAVAGKPRRRAKDKPKLRVVGGKGGKR